MTARKIYGKAPLKYFLLKRNSPKISDICRELARMAKIPPPTVALHTQKVVQAFHRTNAL